ncbi:hypothetical protein IMCC14465_06430 [alpha proteobacterium IMCC14465]|uniref:Uncharacterized protein n=1 Tax=alpha proteobacterium IMCC14465 TaxID=1220535 RepID=J9DUZ6_9PROT|nr:hypothetical protein IMCC14465_06430 [alpha proteobacterium IMCC14465]
MDNETCWIFISRPALNRVGRFSFQSNLVIYGYANARR